MIIARQKRKENIAEYLLYMWQVEDLIRANKFDMDSINRTVIAHYDQPEEVKKEIAQWYEELIEMMRSEGVMEKGHIQLNKNVIITLTDLHLRLLKSPKEMVYSAAYYKTLPYIVQLRAKSGGEDLPELETCFAAVAVRAVPNVTVQNDTATDARAERQEDKTFFALTGADPIFGERGGGAVVRERNRETDVFGEAVANREEVPTREVRRANERTGRNIHRAGGTETDASDVGGRQTGLFDPLQDRFRHPFRRVFRAAFDEGRGRNVGKRFPGVVQNADFDVRAAEVDADEVRFFQVRRISHLSVRSVGLRGSVRGNGSPNASIFFYISVKNKGRKRIFNKKTTRRKVGAKIPFQRAVKSAVLSNLPVLPTVRRRKFYRRFALYPKSTALGRGKQFGRDFSFCVFFGGRTIYTVWPLAARRFLRYNERKSGADGTLRSGERRNESWERKRTENVERFVASSRRRSNWFIRGRVGFATSESSRRRTAVGGTLRANFAFRWPRLFATNVVGRRAFRRGRFADVAVGSRFGRRLAGTPRFVGGVCGEPGRRSLRSTRRVRCIFIAGRRGRSFCS